MKTTVPAGAGQQPTQRPRTTLIAPLQPAAGINVAVTLRANVAVEPHPIRLKSRIVTPPTATSGSTFTDTGTGTVTLSGASSESLVCTDTGAGTITLSGTATDSFSAQPRLAVQVQGRSNQGGVTAAPAAIPDLQAPRSRSAQGLTPSTTTVYNDSGTGTITLSGTSTEVFTGPLRLTVSIQGRSNQGGLTVAPTAATPGEPKDPQPQTFVFYNAAPPIYNVIVQGGTNQGFHMSVVPQPAAVIVPVSRLFAPKGGPVTFTDTGAGTVTLSGSSSESFTGGGTSTLFTRSLMGVGL